MIKLILIKSWIVDDHHHHSRQLDDTKFQAFSEIECRCEIRTQIALIKQSITPCHGRIHLIPT